MLKLGIAFIFACSFYACRSREFNEGAKLVPSLKCVDGLLPGSKDAAKNCYTSTTKSFYDFCKDEGVSESERATINAILADLKTESCEEASVLALSTKELNITFAKDLKPLAGFVELTSFTAQNNGIEDISTIGELQKLTYLNLQGNKIKDILPLARLANLTFLNLSDNEVTDVSVLGGLRNLESLYLANNNISNVRTLASLKKLVTLDLSGNPQLRKTDSVCPTYKSSGGRLAPAKALDEFCRL